MKLQVDDLNSFYGPRISVRYRARGRRRRGGGAARAQRRGKSTTFRSIVGLVEKPLGRILFEGKDVSSEPTHAIVRGGLGYVPEERRIFTDLTGRGKSRSRPSAEAAERAVLDARKSCSRCFPTSARCEAVRAGA
jgi:branched-chain amino acid transport system ATP-binding protein